jgi:hypothetical protein
MDSLWVDQNLDRVNGLFTKRMRSWGLFAPTHQFYESLASGEDRSLENSVDQISSHLQLRLPPSVTYEWGLKLSPQIAGQISLGGTRSHIQIPLFYAGRPDALGAILAHELTHEAIAQEQIKFASIEELEQMTDLSAIALGLGKLILNGMGRNRRYREPGIPGKRQANLCLYPRQRIPWHHGTGGGQFFKPGQSGSHRRLQEKNSITIRSGGLWTDRVRHPFHRPVRRSGMRRLTMRIAGSRATTIIPRDTFRPPPVNRDRRTGICSSA